MAKILHFVFGLILLFCFLPRSRTLTGQDHQVPWYLGCYNDSDVTDDSSHKPVYQEDQMTPVYCVSRCVFNESFRYAAIWNGSICSCLTRIEKNAATNDTFCNISCHGDKNIMCGGTNTSSVYSTAVPLLVSLNISLPTQVKTNTAITIVSTLSIKRQRNEVSALDSVKQRNQTADSIFMEWSSAGKVYNITQYRLQGNLSITSTDLIFQSFGSRDVCVQAYNLFSNQRRCSHVDVLVPINGLRLVTAFQEGVKLPLYFPPLSVTSCKSVYFKYLIGRGSKPQFRFDFGDGSPPLIVADSSLDYDPLDYTCVTVSHIFRSKGKFTVNVTASNAVSLISYPFDVNSARLFIGKVELIKNGRDCIYVEANVSSTLKARILQPEGCQFKVSFQWHFSDSSPNVTTSVPSVSHTFSGAHSRYHVTIVAFTEHGKSEAVEQVCPLKRLQGLILKPKVPHLILSTGQDIEFTTQVIGAEGRVRIKFHRSDKDYSLSGDSYETDFEKPGRYTVQAEAENGVGSVFSNTIVVYVLDKIIGLSIDHEPTILLGKPSHLTATLKKGTDVTFYWSFRHGSKISTINTTSPSIIYNYAWKGKYKIDLVASNALKEIEEETITVYVTDEPDCYPPMVTILGRYQDRVSRSSEIRREGDITLNCSQSKELVYQWKITHASKGKKGNIVKPEGVSFTEQVLILPPCVLDYGLYYIHLEVKVGDTGLAVEKKVRVMVVESQLVAVITGGTTKVVGHNDKETIMNASSSHDPDFPDKNHLLRFNWSCNPLGDRSKSCFNASRTPVTINRNRSVLKFEVDWLLEGVTFEFVVTVTKGSRKFSALQILYVDSRWKPHLLSTNCLQCDKGNINPSSPLIITGSCLSCPLDNNNITYEWQIFHIGNSKPHKEKECQFQPTGDDRNNGTPSSIVKSTRKPMTSLRTSQAQKTPSKWVVVGSRPTNNPLTAKVTSATKPPQARFTSGTICINPNHIYGRMPIPTVKRPTRRPGGGGFGGSGIGSGIGLGGGKGTGSGITTQQTKQTSTTLSPTTDSSDKDNNDDDDDDDDDDEDDKPEYGNIYHPMYTPRSARHSASIIRLKRRNMKLPEKQTTTGLNSQNFVLLGEFLKGGHTYMVMFRVLDGSTGQQGKVAIYFNTSNIPECGTCTLTPSVGVAMETTFQLTCSGWTVMGNWPTSYHISYSVDGLGDDEGKRILVYSGYRSKEVPFVLPPGLASFNHSVQIHVTIASGEAKQTIPPLQVRVLPQTVKEGISMEEVLLNKTNGQYLALLEEVGNEQGIRQFITALANSLNRLGSVKNVTSKFHMRMQIREKLLLLIKNFTIKDKYSAFQTCLALQMLTARPDELAESSVETASNLLQQLGDMMQTTQRRMRAKLVEDRFFLSQEFIEAITRVTSNLIEASSILIFRNARPETRDNVLLKATDAAEKLIKAKLAMQVLGEPPLLLTTPNIRVNATQMASIDNSLFSLGDVVFHTPVNLEEELRAESPAKEGSCYGAMMTVYKENPFYSEMHHTQVGSLSLSNCNGDDLEVRNLSRGIAISIPHKHSKTERRVEKFTLQWKHENIHVINQTEKMVNQVLHIHLEPLSKLPAGFVAKLIASTVNPGSSSQNQQIEYTQSEIISGQDVKMYIGHRQLINASGAVYARVVLEDTAYYRIKSIKKGPSFTYLLSVHWMGCFYWNKEVKEWATDGCKLMHESTEQMIRCRCNHLTAFSGAFLYPPNSLTIKDLTDPTKLKRSPLTLALVISIVALYLVLLGFCIRADKHDKRKLPAVHINENTISGGISERFQITLQTGHWFGAGTSANVVLILHGDDCVSDPIELKSTTDKPLFERSSCDVFVVSLPGKRFSNIRKIHIWHDNSGDHPSWFLEQVIIKDINRGETRVFNCNRWLSVDEADGKVECELQETTSHSSSVEKCFLQHSAKSILDYHLWLSLFGRPSYSRFSRAQRLTCCMSLLLSFLCVNIAWYRPKTEVSEVLGIIDITGESIWIGVLCSLIALPVNLLWIFFFRYSRRSFRHHVKVYPMSEQQTDTTELVSSSVLDQSLEAVLILKNISERKQWFQTVWELDEVHPDGSSSISNSQESLDRASDSSSLGYNSGQGGLSSSQRPLPPPHADLLETCDYLRDIGSGRKKSLEFEKRSTYSVSLASEGRGFYRSRFSLPHGCVYVAWLGCLSTAVTAAVFTVWYGVSFGWDLSVRWFQSLCFSLLESFLISQPFMVVVFILYMAYKSNARKEDEEIDEGFEDLSSSALHDIHYGHINQGFEEETSRSRTDDGFNPALVLRRRQRYLKFLKPPSKSKLSEARSKCVRSKALWSYTIEVMVSILLLLVTCLLVASVTCPDVYHLNQSIKKSLLRSGGNEPVSVKSAWKEISAALHENNASSSYTPFTILLRDSQSLLFGRTKITQFKTTLLTACDEFSGSSNKTFCHATCHAKDGTWFSLELNQTSEESSKQLREITDSQWINACTREITVEFAVYTPFLRAISAATLSVKASFTGKPKCRLKLNTFPVFFESTEQSYFIRICKFVFVVLLFYLLQHEFFLALEMSSKYFTSFWRLTQLLTVAISSMCVVLYIRWSVVLYALLREVQTTSQTDVFYYAKLVSLSQEALQAAYSLLLFFIIVRCVHLLRPFRTMVRFGKHFASVARLLVGCSVVIITFMMAFVHTGHLLFGRLHSAFKSFGDTFLLVSSFFRLEGVNHYQGPAVEEHSVLILFYFALFLIGFYIFMRGTTAAVFLYSVPHFKKTRHKILADFVEDFIGSKIQLLREKLQNRESDSSLDEEEEEEEEDEELVDYERDAPFPMEHVLDEVQVQFEELSLRMGNLMGSEMFDDSRCFSDDLSGTGSDEDVEYLYQSEQRPSPSPVSGSGYDSDHSNMSAAKWQLSSSSSHDLSDCHGKNQLGPGLVLEASARPVTFSLGGSEVRGLGLASPSPRDSAAYPGEKTMRFEGNSDPSCSSCYDMGRSNPSFTDHRVDSLKPGIGKRQSFPLRDDGLRDGGLRDRSLRDGVLRDGELRDGELRDGELRGGFLRDGVWYVGGLRDCVTGDSLLRAEDFRVKPAVDSSAQSETFQPALVMRPQPEPIKPKTLYTVTRAHGRRGHEALSLHPSADAGGSTTEAATSSSSDQEVGRTRKKSRRRRAKGLFRSSAVYPGQEGLSLGTSPPVRRQDTHSKESGLNTVSESPYKATWCLAPSASERNFRRSPASHVLEDSRLNTPAGIAVPSASERGLATDPDPQLLEDSELYSSAWGLDPLTAPDPHVPDTPLEGLMGDISMNRRLGTEIRHDDLPELSTRGDKYKIV